MSIIIALIQVLLCIWVLSINNINIKAFLVAIQVTLLIIQIFLPIFI